MRRTYYLFGFVLLLVSCATQQKLSYADIKYQEIIDLPEAFSKVSLSWLGRTSKLERKAIKSNQLSSIS